MTPQPETTRRRRNDLLTRILLGLSAGALGAGFLLLFLARTQGGNYYARFLIFPYGTIIQLRTSWEFTGMLLTYIQFPLYGAVLFAPRIAPGTRLFNLMIVLVMFAHGVAVWLLSWALPPSLP